VVPLLRAADEPDLKEFRTVDKAVTTRIALSTTPRTSSIPAYLGIFLDKNDKGKPIVVHVDPDSPAFKGGFLNGDEVTAIDKKPFADPAALRDLLKTRSPGDEIKVDVLRKGVVSTLTVKLGSVSSPLSDTPQGGGNTGRSRPVIGVSLELEKGVLKIAELTTGMPAEMAGLKVGDFILKINNRAVDSTDKVSSILGDVKIGDMVPVLIKRGDKEEEIKVKVADGGRTGMGGNTGGFDFRRGTFKGDTYKLAILPIDFSDVKHNEKITGADWEKALFSKGGYSDKSATGQGVFGSMNDYYQEISCGKFKVTGKYLDPVLMTKKREEYSTTTPASSPLLGEALDKLLEKDSKALDGFDGVFFLYSGARVNTSRGGLYWPHKSTIQHKGKRWNYFICPEGGREMASISVISHEFGHMLGLPDLYAKPEQPGSEGLGVWCTMSTGHGRDGKPLHFSAWCKEKMGWLTPAVIDPTVKQKLILSPIMNSDKECYKVLIQPDGSEYLLLENRLKKGFDKDIPGEGLLIWRVVNDRPILEESHGIMGPNGPQRFLGSIPYPSKSNTAFTPLTTPSSKPLTGSGYGVHITNIRRLSDGRITFFIGYEAY